MADFSIASQVRPVQLPDQLQQYAQANQLALHQAQLAEVQRAAQEQNQLRSLLESGVDRNSPDFLKQVYRISPTMGMTLEKGQAELQNAALTRRKTEGDIAAQGPALQKSRAEAATANAKHLTEQLKNVLAYPDDERAGAAYGTLRASAVQMHPEWEGVLPKTLDRKVLEQQVVSAEQAAKQRFELAKPKEPQYLMGPAGPIAIDKNTGTYGVVPEGGAAPAPAAGRAAAPAVGDAQAMRTAQIEGTGKNPMSSAQGLHQFIDSTFVGTAKKVFPELANKSPTEILALRGTKLADGTPIESALEQRFRADNIASLTSAGIQPTPGNTYLAHFLGAGGARSVLGADPSTPVSSLLSADAIAANKSVLEGKTAGEVAAWAANKFGGEPGLAASMTAANARMGGAPAGFVPVNAAPMSPGAPMVNNALMMGLPNAAVPTPTPQNAMLSLQPQIAGALAPPAVAPPAAAPAPTTLAGQRKQIAEEKLAEKGAEQTQKLEIDKRFSEAERAQARQEFDKTLANIIAQYKDLGAKGMLVKSGETTLANRAKAAAATAAPGLTTVLSPERGEAVATLTNMRQTMLSALMGATGMSAKNIDSNAEMRAYLNSLSNPGQPVKTIVDTLNNLSERFGTNMKLKEADLTGGKPQNPSSSKAGPNVDDLLKKYE